MSSLRGPVVSSGKALALLLQLGLGPPPVLPGCGRGPASAAAGPPPPSRRRARGWPRSARRPARASVMRSYSSVPSACGGALRTRRQNQHGQQHGGTPQGGPVLHRDSWCAGPMPWSSRASVWLSNAAASRSCAPNARRQIGAPAAGNMVSPTSDTTSRRGSSPACRRPAACACGKASGQQLRHVGQRFAEHHLAQRAALAQHLAHPQRRQPRMRRDHGRDAAGEGRRQRERLVAGLRQSRPHRHQRRQQALVDQRLQQARLVAEVVVQHRRRDPRLRRDRPQRGGCDAGAAEAGDGRVEQSAAQIVAVAAGATGARGRLGGLRLAWACG